MVLYDIFLYLHKLYDTLDHVRCRGVITAYGQQYISIGVHSMEAYVFQMILEGITHWERLRQRVHCTGCNLDLMLGSLENHCQVQHWVGIG